MTSANVRPEAHSESHFSHQETPPRITLGRRKNQVRNDGPVSGQFQTYEASLTKRSRPTKSDMEARKAALIEIMSEQRPMTVRQVFYQATVRGVIEKTEAGYGKVQRALVDLRRSGLVPYAWIADSTR